MSEAPENNNAVEHPFDEDACVDQLLQRHLPTLRDRANVGGTGLFVLIDPMGGDPVLDEALEADLDTEALNAARSQVWGAPCHSLSLPPRLDLDSAMSPYLVELSGADDPWFDSTLAWALRETVRSWQAPPDAQPAHRVGGWLHSAALGPTLAHKLSGWLVLSTRASTPARYLRLADRRVWSLALHVLGESAVAQRLAPVQCWQWIDAHGACCELQSAPSEHPTDAGGSLVHFSQAQWALMALGDKVHGPMAQERGRRLNTPGEQPAQWPPVSAAQWQAALKAAGHPAPHPKNKTKQEGTPT